MPQPPAGAGWPFLVASGRRRDYSILLAPAFLVAESDYGVLEEALTPGSEEEPPNAVQVSTRKGRSLTLVYATHLLTAGDLARPENATAAEPRDEYNRPLRLMYGFVVPNALVREPASADLGIARDSALEVYRHFLDDEEAFTVVSSQPFPLQSAMADRPSPPTTAPTTRTPWASAGVGTHDAVGAQGVAGAQDMVDAQRAPADRDREGTAVSKSRVGLVLAGVTLLLGLVLVAVLALSTGDGPDEPVCPSVTATAQPGAAVTGATSPTCTPTTSAPTGVGPVR